jgi:hypothetical protein
LLQFWTGLRISLRMPDGIITGAVAADLIALAYDDVFDSSHQDPVAWVADNMVPNQLN